jgi:hypothetical protein
MVSDPYGGLVCKYVITYRKYIIDLENYENIPRIDDEGYNNHIIAKYRKKIFKLSDLLSNKGYDWRRNEFYLHILDDNFRV